MQANLYTRSAALPAKPVIVQAVSFGHDSASLKLATDLATNADAPIAYYTITATKVDATTATKVETQRIYYWKDLSLAVIGLQASTRYTFTVSATTADGTSQLSLASLPVLTTAYVPPESTPMAAPLAAPAFTLSVVAETKTVGTSISGYRITPTDGGGIIASYAISPSAPVGTSFSTATGLLSGTPTSTQSATTYTITATNASGSASRLFTLRVTAAIYAVGDVGPGGGTIFYAPGSAFTVASSPCNTQCLYLEWAPNTWSGGTEDPSVPWSSDVTNEVGGMGTAIGTGFENTRKMLTSNESYTADSNGAAYQADAYRGGGKNDWFLPSIDELGAVSQYARDAQREGFRTGYYYQSSSEIIYEGTAIRNAVYRIYNYDAERGGYIEEEASQDYKGSQATRPIRAFGSSSVSTDARLSTTSKVKGQTPLVLGSPSATLVSATGGSVTINAAQSANTSNMGSFITAFVKNDTGATISRVVKYGNGASYIGFASDSVYNGTDTINSGDFFIIKVSAQDGVTTLYYKIVVTVTYEVGDSGPGGGIVFYVASTPFTCGPTRSTTCTYLEAAPTSGTIRWNDATYVWSGNTTVAIGATAQGTAIGTGYANTLAIVGQSPTANKAATISQAYRGPNDLSDWFLPSKDELNQMCKWQAGVAWTSDATVCTGGTINTGPGAAGFVENIYWSSSEYRADGAWYQYFDPIGGQDGFTKYGPFYVRPVRAF
jgi:hypothetical protein